MKIEKTSHELSLQSEHFLIELIKFRHIKAYGIFFEPHVDYINIDLFFAIYEFHLRWWKEAKSSSTKL